jgi:hypothetical protein
MAVDLPKGCGHSVYAVAGIGAGHSVVAQLVADRSCGHSVVAAFRSIVPDRKVTVGLSARESLPNAFYGLVEQDQASFEVPNLDRALSFLREQLPYKAPVRIRRVDLRNQERTTLFEGSVTALSVGKKVTFTAKAVDLTSLGVSLPRNRVVDTSNPPPEGLLPHDITVNFVDPPDAGAGIPIVFGRADGVRCLAIERDVENNRDTYLACEDLAVVETVEKLSNGSWHAGFTSTGKVIGAGVTNDGRGYLLIPHTNPWDTNVFVNLMVTITNGKGAGQVRKIVEHIAEDVAILDRCQALNVPLPRDTVPRLVIIETPWANTPDYLSEFEIREFEVLAGNPYARRTAIRFHSSQAEDGIPKPVRARIAQYHMPRKNLLAWTDRADKFTTDTTPGWWQHILGGHGIGQFDTTSGFASTDFASLLPGGVHTQFISVLINAPVGAPLDQLGAVQIPGGASQGYCLQETGVPAEAGFYIFSGWFFSTTVSNQQVRCFIQLDDGSGRTEFTVTATPGLGTRFNQPAFYNSPGRTIQVGFFGLNNTTVFVAPFALQVERATELSYPERVDAPGNGRVWSFPDAIRRLLSDPVYGAGTDVAVVHESFESANEKLYPFHLLCQGAIPDAANEGGQLPDVLNELLQVRGMFLRPQGGALALDVDDVALSPVSTVGIGAGLHETPLKQADPVQFPDPLSLVRAVEVQYNLTHRSGEDNTDYSYVLSKTIGTMGAPKRELRFRFVRDHNTADRALQYLAGRLSLPATWKISAGEIGRAWRVKDVVDVIDWQQQVENLIRASDDLTNANWTYQAGSGTARALVDPEGRARIATRLAAGTTVLQTISASCDDRFVYATVSVYSDTPSRIRLALWNVTEQKGVDITTGPGWTEHTITHEYMGSVIPQLYLTVPAGQPPVYVSRPHVRRDYDYAYAPTENQAVLADTQQRWQVSGLTRNGVGGVEADLIPYRSDIIYAFTASDYSKTIQSKPGIDSTLLAPLPVLDIGLPPDPSLGIPTAQAGFDIAQDGSTNSWVNIGFVMPDDDRIQRVEAQLRKFGDVGWETKAVVPTAQTPPGTTGTVFLSGLVPGVRYEIRFVSYSFRGLTSGTQLTGEFVAYGDKTAPPPPTGVVARRGTGKAITVTVYVDSDPVTGVNKLPGDWAGIRIYRAETTTSSQVPVDADYVAVGEQASLLYQDTEVEYLRWYRYKVTTFDYSGNESPAYGPTPPIEAALIHGGVEVQDGTITANKIKAHSIVADRLVIGSLDNLLENPGFEFVDNDDTALVPSWLLVNGAVRRTPATYAFSGSARSGASAVEFTSDGNALCSTQVTAFEGDPFHVECYVRAFGTASGIVGLRIRFFSQDGAELTEALTNRLGTEVTSWTKLEVKAVAPAGVGYATVDLISLFMTPAVGSIVFDDVYARRRVGSAEIYQLKITGATGDGTTGLTVVRGTGSEIGFDTEAGVRIATIDVHPTLDAVSIKSPVNGQGRFSIGVETGSDNSRFELLSFYATGAIFLNSNTLVSITTPEIQLSGTTVLRADGLIDRGTFVYPDGPAPARLRIIRGGTVYTTPLYPEPVA